MNWNVNNKLALIELLNKECYRFNFKLLKRNEVMFLPIEFSNKNDVKFYPSIFSFTSNLFEQKLVKELFNYNASHLEAIDKNKFIIHFAFQYGQVID